MSDIENSRFGVEFEVCVCDYNSAPEQDQEPDYEYIEYLGNKFNSKLKSLGFQNDQFMSSSSPHLSHDYSKWLVTIDPTIECPKNQTDIKPNHTSFRNMKPGRSCVFHGAEIVSPVTHFRKADITNFFGMYDTILFQDGLVYETNDTQGMHINVSHPRQDYLKFIRFWWYFEDVFLSFIPKIRRRAIPIMARPLRRIFKELEDLEEHWSLYYAEAVSKFSAVSLKPNRLEIRIVDSNLIPLHVFSWVRLIVKLLYASITMELDTTIMPSAQYLFTVYIRDKELEHYFLQKAAEFSD